MNSIDFKKAYTESIKELPLPNTATSREAYEPIVVSQLSATIGNHLHVLSEHNETHLPNSIICLPMQRSGIDIIKADEQSIQDIDFSKPENSILLNQAIDEYCKWRGITKRSAIADTIAKNDTYLAVTAAIDVKTTDKHNVYMEMCNTQNGTEFGHYADGNFKPYMPNFQIWGFSDKTMLVDVHALQCLSIYEDKAIKKYTIRSSRRDHNKALLLSPQVYSKAESHYLNNLSLQCDISVNDEGNYILNFPQNLDPNTIIDILEQPSGMYLAEDENKQLKLVYFPGELYSIITSKNFRITSQNLPN